MSSEWEEQFKQMRSQFFERARQRLENTAVLLAAAERAGGDNSLHTEALQQLWKDFHWLAGTGGTYKLPQMTDIGRQGEDICDALLHGTARANSYSRLNELLAQARAEIDHAAF